MSTLKTNNIQHVDLADPSILINSDGSVSIAGTVSYEDATNVDSVGIITGRLLVNAQKQVHVGTGVSVKAGGLNVTAGITTVQALQATTGTFSGDVDLGNANSDTITMAGRVDSDINPSGSTRDLGTTGVEWRNLYTANGVIASDVIATHASDTDTRIRFPAVDTIAIETAGSERARITSGGDLLLGTTTAAISGGVGLMIADAAGGRIKLCDSDLGVTASDGFELIASDAGTAYVWNRENMPLLFGTNNTQRMSIDAVGDIFIGTTSDIAPANGTNLCVSDSVISRIILEKQSTIKFGINVSNTFQIYDETNSASRLTIDSSGRLLINTTSTASVSDGESPKLQIKGPDSTAGISLVRYSADAAGGGIYIAKSRNTTHGSNTILQDDDELGRITFSGDDGTDLHTQGVQLMAQVGGTPGGNGMPADFVIMTNPGLASVTERVRVTANGRVLVRTTTNNGCKFVVNQAENDTMSTSGNMTTGFFLGCSGMGSAALNIGTDNTDIWFNAAYANNAGSATGMKFYNGGTESLHIRADRSFDFPHSGFLYPDGDLTVSLGSGLSNGSYAEVIAPGVMAHTGMYAIRVFWDFNGQGGIPYYCSAAFLYAPVATNANNATNKVENLISSCHVGGDYYLAARSKTASSSSSGLEISINGWTAAANSRFLVKYKRIF